jgi:hypothetical protein
MYVYVVQRIGLRAHASVQACAGSDAVIDKTLDVLTVVRHWCVHNANSSAARTAPSHTSLGYTSDM